jgi:hypothetical protein
VSVGVVALVVAAGFGLTSAVLRVRDTAAQLNDI